MSHHGSSHERAPSTPEAAAGAGSSARSPIDGGFPALPIPRSDDLTVISAGTPSAAPLPTNGNWAATLIGETLDHFRLEAIVGSGGMGTVYRAVDVELNRVVAVKVRAPESVASEEHDLRFRNEAESAARLDHVNVARVHHFGECRGYQYIVYEFIEGINVRDLVYRDGPLAVGDAVSYTLQIAETLDHAFERSVVHRDIKPSNILVTADGVAKLVDMGLARLHQVEHSRGDLTESGATLGTFDFISPEQARDARAADVRSDIYSLGCTLYFMLTGRPPFPDGTVLKKLLQHAQDDPPDPREVRRDVPAALVRVLDKMLAKSPDERYQTPRELIAELRQVAVDGSEAAGNVAIWKQPVESLWQRIEGHVPWLAPVLLLLALAAWIEFGGRSEPETVARVGDPANGTLPSEERLSPSSSANDQSPAVLGPNDERPSTPENGSGRPSVSDAPVARPQPRTPPNEASEAARESKAATRTNGHSERTATAATAAASDPTIVDEDVHPLRRRLTAATNSPANGPGETAAAAAIERGPTVRATAGDVADGRGVTTAKGSAALGTVLVRPFGDPDASDAVGSLDRALADAVAAAQVQGATEVRLELSFHGELEVQPVNVPRFPVTLAAAANHRPQLIFRPRSIDPQDHARSMFRLFGGQLTLLGVDVTVELPRDPTEGWSLIELQDAERLRLDGCTLTIRNAHGGPLPTHQGVAFFDVRPRRASPSMMADEEEPQPPLLAIRLDSCVVRGEATLLKTSAEQAVRLAWHNGLLMTSERLLVTEGLAREPLAAGDLRIALEHVTAFVAGGMFQSVDTATARFPLTAAFECEACLFVGDGNHPLVEQRGAGGVEDCRERFLYRGEGNFYENFPVLWRIRSAAEGEQVDWDFTAWKAHWADRERLSKPTGQVRFRQLPPAHRPVHTHVPADYALVADESNPAHAAAERGRDAGCDFSQLPALGDAVPSVEPSRDEGAVTP